MSLLALGFTHQKGLFYQIFELEDSGLPQQSILPISARKTVTMANHRCLEKDSHHCALAQYHLIISINQVTTRHKAQWSEDMHLITTGQLPYERKKSLIFRCGYILNSQVSKVQYAQFKYTIFENRITSLKKQATYVSWQLKLTVPSTHTIDKSERCAIFPYFTAFPV